MRKQKQSDRKKATAVPINKNEWKSHRYALDKEKFCYCEGSKEGSMNGQLESSNATDRYYWNSFNKRLWNSVLLLCKRFSIKTWNLLIEHTLRLGTFNIFYRVVIWNKKEGESK